MFSLAVVLSLEESDRSSLYTDGGLSASPPQPPKVCLQQCRLVCREEGKDA